MASVLVFCVPCALMSICLDPTHLVTCLLIKFPQLLSLVTLLICSLYNLLVFAVPCGFVAICWVIYVLCPALSCLALPCLVQPCPVCQSVFPLRGSFCLFCLSMLLKKLVFLLHLGPRLIHSPVPDRWGAHKWSPENLKHDWSSVFQLIVPQSYRENELGVAHDHELSGHLDIKKTYNNLLKHFFWPGLKSTVSQCCRSCHACQVAGKPNLVISSFSIILKANSSDE